MIKPRPGIEQVIRLLNPNEARDRFVCLDKNERVDPFPEAAVREMLASLSSEDFCRYPVLEPFYTELAAYLSVPRDHLLLANGTDGAIRHVYEVYVRPGDVAVVLSPTYAMYDVYARLYGLHLRPMTFDRDLVLPVEKVVAAITEDVRLVLIANPNAPTGTAFTVSDMARIVEAASRHGAIVLVDEAYYYFSEQTVLKLVREFDNLIVARSFSKAGGLAGLRVGFLVSQPQNIEYLGRVRPVYEINGMAMKLGRYLVRHPNLLWDYARAANEGREYLTTVFDGLGLRVFKSHANFVVARPPAGTDIRKLVNGLRERGYLIKGPFGDPPLTDCLRVTTASVPVMTGFARAFTEVYRVQTSGSSKP